MEENKDDVIEVKKVEEIKNEPTPKQESVPETEEKSEESKTKVIREEPMKDKKGFSIAALVLGIVAIVLCCIWYISIPCGILAIVFGILGIKSSKRGMSIAGLVTGAIGLIVAIIIFFALVIIGMAVGITEGLDSVNFDSNFYDNYQYNRDLFE